MRAVIANEVLKVGGEAHASSGLWWARRLDVWFSARHSGAGAVVAHWTVCVRTRKSRGLPPFLVLFVALQTVSEGPSVVGPLCGKVADCQFLRGDRVVPTIRLRVRGGQRIGSLRRRMEPVCLSSPLHRLAPIA